MAVEAEKHSLPGSNNEKPPQHSAQYVEDASSSDAELADIDDAKLVRKIDYRIVVRSPRLSLWRRTLNRRQPVMAVLYLYVVGTSGTQRRRAQRRPQAVFPRSNQHRQW